MIDVTELAGTVFSGLSALVIDATEELDPVTQDMLIGQSGQLEEFHRSSALTSKAQTAP